MASECGQWPQEPRKKTHEDRLARMRRTQESSITQPLERDALLARNREERGVGGELEVQQPTLFLQHGASLDSGDAD